MKTKIGNGDMEGSIQGIMLEAGQRAFGMGFKAIDDRIEEKLPRGWQNVGKEERWIVSSIGELRYRRRVYLDENNQQRKPVDEILRVERYGRVRERVQEMGSSLACIGYLPPNSQLAQLVDQDLNQS